ncbi:MAG: ATP-binding protein [Rhodocyclales bacterium]|nr:ATP-binding protein [Rhodocyclales bacterium]
MEHLGQFSISTSSLSGSVFGQRLHIGISPEQQATLFQAFTQVDGSMTRKYGGSGLGLVISKRLASLMGGDAGVVAQEGSGCTFWATVRLKSAKVGEVVI